MYGITKSTLKQKLFILGVEIIYLIVAWYLLFVVYDQDVLAIGMFVALIFTTLRLTAMMFIWLPRGISWKEAVMNSIMFAIYYIGFPVFMMISTQQPNRFMVITGWILFVGGSLLNTISELLRKPFKDNPANKGRLYTGGLFQYAMHINYLGDCLWVLGLAMISNNVYSLVIPLGLFLVFVFDYIPKSDQYLRQKYGAQFVAYEQKTKKLIPFIW